MLAQVLGDGQFDGVPRFVLGWRDGLAVGEKRAEGAVAAVPEPETYAMLFAGLGLLGFASRRRKQTLAA